MFKHSVSLRQQQQQQQQKSIESFVDLTQDYDTWFAKPILTTSRHECLLLQDSYRKGCAVFCQGISPDITAETFNISSKELTISIKCGLKFHTVDLSVIDLDLNDCTEQQARDYLYNEVFMRSALKSTHKFCIFTYDSSLTDRDAVRYVFCFWYKSVSNLSNYLYKIIDHEKVCDLIGLTPERKRNCLKWQLRIQMKNIQVFSYRTESGGSTGCDIATERIDVLGLWKSRLAIRTVSKPALYISLFSALIFGLLACFSPLLASASVSASPLLAVLMVAVLSGICYPMLRNFNFKSVTFSVVCCIICLVAFPYFLTESYSPAVDLSAQLTSKWHIWGLSSFYIYLYLFWVLACLSVVIFSGLYGKYISSYPVLSRTTSQLSNPTEYQIESRAN